MDAKDFIKLLSNPDEVEKMPVDELKNLSLRYPYSQPVQLLYTIRLSQSSEYLFNRQLGKTSILTDDRSVLFDLFEREREEAGSTTMLEQRSEKEPRPVVKIEAEPSVPQPPVSEEMAPEPPPEKAPAESPAKEVIEMEAEEKPAPMAPVPQPLPAPTEKEPKRKPLDLTGLSPHEKVQAILAENKRIREQFVHKKTAPHTDVEKAEKPEETLQSQTVEEEQPVQQTTGEPADTPQPPQPKAEIPEKVTKEEEPAEEDVSTHEDLSGTEAPVEEEYDAEVPHEPETAAVETGPVADGEPEGTEVADQEEEISEPAVFTIDEEAPEPVFEIEPEEDRAPQPAEEVTMPREAAAASAPEELKKESHSFAEWLHILKSSRLEGNAAESAQEIKPQTVEKPVLPVERKIELLDSFVEKLPELKRKNIAAPRPDKPSISMGNLGEEDEGSLVTETLAKVYLRQKHYEKAIKAYEIMKLKYPEKSSFFADQISEIRKLINSK